MPPTEPRKDWLKKTSTENSCKYHDVPDLNKIHIYQPDFLIIHQNVSSLVSQINELKFFPSLFKASFDIICISMDVLLRRTDSLSVF